MKEGTKKDVWANRFVTMCKIGKNVCGQHNQSFAPCKERSTLFAERIRRENLGEMLHSGYTECVTGSLLDPLCGRSSHTPHQVWCHLDRKNDSSPGYRIVVVCWEHVYSFKIGCWVRSMLILTFCESVRISYNKYCRCV